MKIQFNRLSFIFCFIEVTPDPLVENANCDFEAINNTLCGFYQDDKDDFDWTLNSGDTNSDFTGPTTDHTLGTPEGLLVMMQSLAVSL